ncbi:FxSxx-COOH system tetratricopeptide repeat protein [Actinocorallia sp. B10E7]|uniref:FxSxx-COOH system tetratricopeptide repeat protein n=1 Tax=Actinocorallia sp. B10E7 TaxID=3153558 RepID=UPI00325D9004
MIEKLFEALRDLSPRLTPEEIQDALWLAEHLGPPAPRAKPSVGEDPPRTEPPPERSSAPPPPGKPGPVPPPDRPPPVSSPPEMGLFLSDGVEIPSSRAVRVPAPKAIPSALPIARALRPLHLKTDSSTSAGVDERRTAERIAETGLWQPLLAPLPERRFELALVVDESASMPMWRQTIKEFHSILRQLGAFRDIRLWRLVTSGRRAPRLLSGDGSERAPEELLDPAGRRIVLLVSDCLGPAWQDERIAKPLDLWGGSGPVAIVQPLPERLWWRSGVSMHRIKVASAAPGVPNSRLRVELPKGARERPSGLAVPVLDLSPRRLEPWALMVAQGRRELPCAALFTGGLADRRRPPEPTDLTSIDRVTRFRAATSPHVYKLACYLAAAPLRQPVMRLVQYAMLPDSTPADLAEVQLSGLLRLVVPPEDPNPYDLAYEFHDGVRPLLLDGLHRSETMSVLRNVWNAVRDNFGSSLDFPALLEVLERNDSGLPPDHAFAQVAAEALGKMGGRYAKVAKQIASRLPLGMNDRFFGPLPPRNPYFTGRSELLRSLEDIPVGGVTALLPRSPHGTGGEGKSELALEHAYRSAGRYELICWLPADRPDIVRSRLAKLAARLRIPPSGDLREIARELQRAPQPDRRRHRWLFVFDGARSPQELLPLLPLSEEPSDGTPLRLSVPSWSVLVTSTDRRWEELTTALKVDVFERAESIHHLLQRIPELSESEADRLAEQVGDLPLALEQAATWQNSTGRTAAEYRELFARHLRSLPDPLPGDVSAQVAATLGLGLERLGEEHPRARRLFDLWAFFGTEPVTAQLLFLGRNASLPADVSDLISDRTLLRETMQTIGRSSVARFDPEKETLQADPVVRHLLETGIPTPYRPYMHGFVQAILAEAVRVEADEEQDWEQRSLITPHVAASGLIDAAAPDLREAVLRQTEALVQDGDLEGARFLAIRALNRWRNVHGPDDPLVLRADCLMADVRRGTGETRAAAEASKKTYERAEAVYGPGDPTTLSAALAHGAGLRHLGAFGAAYERDLQTWQQMARRFEQDSVGPALLAADGVALGLRLLGNFPEAYDIDRQVLDRLEQSPASRPRTLFRVTHQLARDLHGLGRYNEALELQRRSLQNFAPSLPANHPLVLHARMSHAETLRAAGLHEEAEQVASSAAEAHARRFGTQHPNTFVARMCLAGVRLSAGRPHEALGLQQEAWSGLLGVLGEEHPFVRACAAGLAIVHRALGDVPKALEIDQRALDVSYTDPYYSLFPFLGLGLDLYLGGELEAARTRSAETLTRLTARLGEGHPATLVCAHNHRLIGIAAGLPLDPAPDPVERLGGLLGTNHPIVRTARQGDPVEFFLPPPPL